MPSHVHGEPRERTTRQYAVGVNEQQLSYKTLKQEGCSQVISIAQFRSRCSARGIVLCASTDISGDEASFKQFPGKASTESLSGF